MTDHYYISPEFHQAVYHHILGNLLLKNTESPLILGIFGPPGEGKTFQTEAVCRRLGVETLSISPGELESPNAGQPGELIRRLYLEASEATQSGRPTVILLNDVDTVLGHWGELVQYTVNRQVVFGQLMALCDYPTMVAGHSVTRIPIIITGNDPSSLHQPLLRPGRTRVFSWKPSLSERLPVVEQMFPQIPRKQLQQLLSAYEDESVAFWADARAAIWETTVANWAESQSPDQVLSLIRANRRVQIEGERVTLLEVQKIVDGMRHNASARLESYATRGHEVK